MKEKIYKSCVRSAMLYGSEAWCLREKEMVILRRTERAMIRAGAYSPCMQGMHCMPSHLAKKRK